MSLQNENIILVTWVKKLTKWVLYLYAAKSRQSCPTLRNPIDSNPPGSGPWDSPGKNTGVGCHFLLQCMKVKSENEVTQLCLTLCDPMYCSLQGPSIHGISQARVPERVAIAFSGIYMTHGLKGFFKLYSHRENMEVLVTQLCPALCVPMDCSLPGTSVNGIL